jgi:hypothetical protein
MKKLFAFLLIPALLLSACGEGNPAPSASPSAQNETDAPTPDGKSETESAYSAYAPIVVDGYLLGGVSGDYWLNSESTFQKIDDTENYKVYIAEQFAGEEPGVKVKTKDPNALAQQVEIDLTENPMWLTMSSMPHYLAVSSEKDVFARSGEFESDTGAPAFESILTDYLAEEQFKDFGTLNLQIKQVFKTDIEGDGAEDIIISADNQDSETADAYGSVVFIHKTVDGTARNIGVENTLFPADEETARSSALYNDVLWLCDLNGDNNLELILKTYTEGLAAFSAIEFLDNMPKTVFVNGFMQDQAE